MYKSKQLLCADRIMRDANDNSIAVIGLFEDSTAVSFPLAIPRFSIIWLLERTELTDPIETVGNVILSSNGTQIQSFDVGIDFQGGKSTRVILVVGGVFVPGPGKFVVTANAANITDTYEFSFDQSARVLPPQQPQPGA